MATKSDVTTICDNCGAEERRVVDSRDDGWRSELPSLSSNLFTVASYIGGSPDYCPACVQAVKDAIAAALAQRKAGAKP